MQLKPVNLIVLCSDEMRGDCLGIMGNHDVLTPNIDNFAKNAVLFRQHYTCHGKCVPSRAAFMTGRYSHTDGFRDIFRHIPPEQPNLLGQLKKHGYQSAVFGKNHCWETMFEGYVDDHSWTEGYQDFFNGKPADPGDTLSETEYVQLGMNKGYDYKGNRHSYSDEVYTEQAIDYLKNTRDKERPFFMQINLEAPHPPYHVEEPYFSMYDRKDIKPFPYELPVNAPLPLKKMREIRTGINENERAFREVQATYYGMISKVDDLVGDILKAVKEEDLFENTVILFWVDHGDFAGQYGLVEKWDTCMNDCIMHVPSIVYSPAIPKGKVIDNLTSHVDLAPTIFELTGIPPIAGIQGKSLVPLMEEGKEIRPAVFADGGHEEEMIRRAPLIGEGEWKDSLTQKDMTYVTCPGTMARTKMVRTDRYKLVMRLQGGNELYDMEKDPFEMNNLWEDSACIEIKAELMEQMINWCMETDPDSPYMETVRA